SPSYLTFPSSFFLSYPAPHLSLHSFPTRRSSDLFSWSPDEKWFAIRARNPGRVWRIYLIPSQGGEAEPLMPGENEHGVPTWHERDRKSTRLNSSHLVISYAVFCLKKKTQKTKHIK